MKRYGKIAMLVFMLGCCLAGSAEAASHRRTRTVEVVEQNAPAVVNISTERVILLRESPVWGYYGNELDLLFDQYFGPSYRTHAVRLKSVGSGVVVDTSGLIVTNAHVVNMASSLFVILNDGTSVPGEVVYEDQRIDLALVRIDPPRPLAKIALAEPDDAMIGETVISIGNPLGLENSVSVGVLSGRNRTLDDRNGEPIFINLLQTDAPINPGNSGGALINLDGELIGINVAVVQYAQGIGFAIPVKTVRAMLDDFTRQGARVKRGLGAAVPAFPPPAEAVDPSAQMAYIRRQMNRMMQDMFPAGDDRDAGMFDTNIFYDTSLKLEETDHEYVIRMDIADLDKNKIDVQVNRNAIVISGEQSAETRDTTDGAIVESRRFGSFSRSMPMPADADPQSVTTEVQGDTLLIHIRKQ